MKTGQANKAMDRQANVTATTATTSGWDAFWFTPSDCRPLAAARIAVGFLLLIWFCSFNGQLDVWFGAGSVLPTELLIGDHQPENRWMKPSMHYYLGDHLPIVQALHVLALATAACLCVGFFTVVSAPAALLLAFSYMNRTSIVAGPVEPVLALSLLYLALGPCGKRLSLDRLFFGHPSSGAYDVTIRAGVVLRLWQVHFAGLIFVMGLAKVQAGDWWNGQAPWLLLERESSRLAALPFLAHSPLLMSILSVAVVLYELCFPALMVFPSARRCGLLAFPVVYLPAALMSGEVFFVALLAASLPIFWFGRRD